MNYKILNDIDKYIDEILDIDSNFYNDEYIWTKDYQRKIYERNQDSFILIGDGDKLVGYLNYLCVTKEKYDTIKNSDTTVDEFELEDVITLKKGDNYITINSVVIMKEYQNTGAIKYINEEFLKKLNEYEQNDIHIKGIDGVAVSDDGQKFFRQLGFIMEKELNDGNRLYLIEDNNELIPEKINKVLDNIRHKKA